jgi:outer membrane protein TolC
MKRFLIIIFILANAYRLAAQDTITLDYCYRQVEKNYPLAQQTGLNEKSSDLRILDLNKNYLPSLNLNASASLQSDVTSISLDLPKNFPAIAFPSPDKDQYKVTLDVNESVYDGNITHFQKKIEKFNLQADQKNVQIQLYQLKDQINQLYFTIFLLQKNEDLLKNTKENINSKVDELKSAVANGTQLQSSIDALDAEVILIDQQLVGIAADRVATFKMLSELISVPVSESSHLQMPNVTVSAFIYENHRPENELFDIQQGRISVMKNMVTSKWNPKILAFGQVGYGRPGFNMLSNDFTTFWIFGGKLTWNFWNWNQNKNEKKIYDIQNQVITTQKETFDKNLRIASEKNLSEIVKLTDMLTKDDDLITLRDRITKTASSQLDNGVITSSDYISRLNEELQSRMNRELHQIQLVRAKMNYLFTIGKL